MHDANEEAVTEQICEHIELLKWEETRELGLNAQQVAKIKRGEKVRFYAKTYQRLKEYFGIK